MGWIHKLFFLDKAAEDPGEKVAEREQPTDSTGSGSGTPCFLVLLDNSGSMQQTDIPPSRIMVACQAVVRMLKFLAENCPLSRVGIATFSDEFHLCSRPLQVGKHLDGLIASLADLGDSGSTEMKRGLLGIQNAMKWCPTGFKAVVVMLTDGHNTGRSPAGTASAIKAEGADIWTIGIGASPSDVDESLLRKLASTPAHYSFVGSWEGPQAIIHSFEQVARIYLLERPQ